MDYDEFKITIKKDGTVEIQVGDEVKKVRHYREIFQDAIGPIKQEIHMPDGAPSPVKQVEKK